MVVLVITGGNPKTRKTPWNRFCGRQRIYTFAFSVVNNKREGESVFCYNEQELTESTELRKRKREKKSIKSDDDGEGGEGENRRRNRDR